MPVSKRLRYEILRRDGHACRYCGAEAPDAKLTIDHVIPVALGGLDEPANLVTACASCNAGKSSSNPDAPIVEGVCDDALRWAMAMRRAAEIQAADLKHGAKTIKAFLSAWKEHYIPEARDDPRDMDLPDDWKQSVERLTNGGLDQTEILHAIEATMASLTVPNHRLFRYFCGICWKRLRARQDIAAQLLEAGEHE